MFKIDNSEKKVIWSNGRLNLDVALVGKGFRFLFYKQYPSDILKVIETTGDENFAAKITGENSAVLSNDGISINLKESEDVLNFEMVEGNKILFGGSSSDFVFNEAADNENEFYLKACFSAFPNEKIFGMGQYQNGLFNLKGAALELKQKNTQVSIPFYISDYGYAFFWNNPAIGSVSFEADKTVWEALCTEKVDFWICAAATPKEGVRSFADITGKAPMMPDYGMGFWQSRLRYWNQKLLMNVAREYKKRDIPLDVIICDYYHYPVLGDMRFDEEFFPDPDAMIAELKEMGVKLMISTWPQINFKSENFREMSEKGLLIKKSDRVKNYPTFGKTLFFDMTNPDTREYVWDKCKKNYYDKGIDLFWLDEIEPHLSMEAPEKYTGFGGKHLKTGNIYPLLCEKAFYDGQTREGQKDIVNLSRCGWAGSQKYGALLWSGDVLSTYGALKKQVVAGQQIGLTGISWWNTDIGGFNCGVPALPRFRNLLIRWFEYAVFCPVMRLHGFRFPVFFPMRKNGKFTFFSGWKNEIWSYGKKNYNIMLKYIHLREKLRPYTKLCYEQAHLYGDPLIRTLFYEFPDDKKCWGASDQYMFGENLLVAPILKAYTAERKVYLPSGAVWKSIIDGMEYQGGAEITVKARLDEIPVFIRCDGSENSRLAMEIFNFK